MENITTKDKAKKGRSDTWTTMWEECSQEEKASFECAAAEQTSSRLNQQASLKAAHTKQLVLWKESKKRLNQIDTRVAKRFAIASSGSGGNFPTGRSLLMRSLGLLADCEEDDENDPKDKKQQTKDVDQPPLQSLNAVLDSMQVMVQQVEYAFLLFCAPLRTAG